MPTLSVSVVIFLKSSASNRADGSNQEAKTQRINQKPGSPDAGQAAATPTAAHSSAATGWAAWISGDRCAALIASSRPSGSSLRTAPSENSTCWAPLWGRVMVSAASHSSSNVKACPAADALQPHPLQRETFQNAEVSPP